MARNMDTLVLEWVGTICLREKGQLDAIKMWKLFRQ